MGDSKRFKISSVANARKLIDDHPFAPKSGNLYVADITPTRALASSGGTFTSPSGRPMRYASQSRRNRTLDEMNERIESSRQNTLGLLGVRQQRRHAAFKSIEQYWDYEHPCGHCGRVWLGGSTAGLRMKCCQGGRMWDLTCPFILHSMPQVLDIGFFDSDFVHSSNQYNNILAMGAVGVENDKPTRGYDKIVGNHCLRMCGRTYHYFPSSERRGGIQYFLHDGRQGHGELSEHGRERQVNDATLVELFKALQEGNKLCKLYSVIGTTADSLIEARRSSGAALDVVGDLIPLLNLATEEFDISAITMDRRTGNHFLQVKQ